MTNDSNYVGNIGYYYQKLQFLGNEGEKKEWGEISKGKDNRDKIETLKKEIETNEEKLKKISFHFENEKILNYKPEHNNYDLKEIKIERLIFKTTYPGLLVGSGLNHEVGADEFKLGFSFDYTSGLPVIPGSSVKGVLRSAFPNDEKDPKFQYIKDKLATFGVNSEDINVLELKKEIFDGIKEENGDKNIRFNERDIFFDAVLTDNNNDKHIFGEDYITPHSDPLKNPIPVKFLKILPEIEFEFRFLLNDSKVNDKITANVKKELFKQILCDLGVGAKTNVGYGNLISTNLSSKNLDKKTEKSADKKTAPEKAGADETSWQDEYTKKTGKKVKNK
ncbi:CRISPR-associated RAMP protein, Cmr6 family [Methanococcus vannielii SB]|uniref:CRISPR-associated RAMP protein, Cmr6 family n=1 Tax=Methanococcus vannielii (strain ATCC 35089 / DSM 1224 / JCM 13029 / OCM 148 / SB) TaxID=406327 RepID=A6UNF1_METVS|nr:type III-B CRISPR module RAMP protein Cmr6 [Methanococcus vannielii]ABR54023.1 CRISPR-associated RAMP protein, Cmr6 family [Methanococcus vannielii SB]